MLQTSHKVISVKSKNNNKKNIFIITNTPSVFVSTLFTYLIFISYILHILYYILICFFIYSYILSVNIAVNSLHVGKYVSKIIHNIQLGIIVIIVRD